MQRRRTERKVQPVILEPNMCPIPASKHHPSLERTWLQTPASSRLSEMCHACDAAASSDTHRQVPMHCFIENGDCQTQPGSRPDRDTAMASQAQLKPPRASLGQPRPSRAIVRSARTSAGNRPERGNDKLYSGSMVRARFASLDQKSTRKSF